jgi:hypothetical protein
MLRRIVLVAVQISLLVLHRFVQANSQPTTLWKTGGDF